METEDDHISTSKDEKERYLINLKCNKLYQGVPSFDVYQ